MLSTPFASSDADLLWSKDGSNIYLKLSDFKNYFQVYVEANHVDVVKNAKPSNGANVANAKAFDVTHDEVSDVIILFSQFYNPTICLDIKDFEFYDFNPSNDHVSFDSIVCHQSLCDPKDDVFAFVYDSIPCFNSQIYNYYVASKVCQRYCFLAVDDRELENVNIGGCKSNKHVDIWAKNAFDEWQ
jgi:hypothetical protein